jgi:hypothetical protein
MEGWKGGDGRVEEKQNEDPNLNGCKAVPREMFVTYSGIPLKVPPAKKYSMSFSRNRTTKTTARSD